MTDRSRDPEAAATTAAEQAGARRKSRSRGGTSGKLATLLRRCESGRRQECRREESTSDIRSAEHGLRGSSSSRLSFLDFVCNVKKHLLLKNLCKSKKKVGPFFPFFLPVLLCPQRDLFFTLFPRCSLSLLHVCTHLQ